MPALLASPTRIHRLSVMRQQELPAGLKPCFPHGRRKAFVLSYDDATEHDRRLVDIFNRYGLRASFHVNSGKLGQPGHIARRELCALYRGHEVSCHSVTHPYLTSLDDDAVRREIADDRRALEDLTGSSVRGLAYPFGAYDARVMALLPELGIEYARTAHCSAAFAIPQGFLEWHTTCHHNGAMELLPVFLGAQEPSMSLMTVWGHSYELDGIMSADRAKDWQYMEALCHRLHDQSDIHFATIIDVVDYLNALDLVDVGASAVSNNSSRAVWVDWHGKINRIESGAALPLQD